MYVRTILYDCLCVIHQRLDIGNTYVNTYDNRIGAYFFRER